MIKTAVILAAGLGSRLGEHTSNIPKGLLQIDSIPILVRSIQILISNGIEKIIIGTGYLENMYRDALINFDNIVFVNNDSYDKTGSFYTLYNLKEHIDSDFLLLESDLLYDPVAISSLINNKNKDIILSSGKTNSGDEVYIKVDKQNNLVNMSKVGIKPEEAYSELVGISKISIELFNKVTMLEIDSYTNSDYENALVNVAQTQPIYVMKIMDLIWCEIDTAEHLNRAKNIIFPKLKRKEIES